MITASTAISAVVSGSCGSMTRGIAFGPTAIGVIIPAGPSLMGDMAQSAVRSSTQTTSSATGHFMSSRSRHT